MSGFNKDELETEARRGLDALKAKTADKPLGPRDRMAVPVQEMPCQNPELRRSNMEEVTSGYGECQARLEAERCLQCRNAPCVQGCPVGVHIPEFIAKLREGEFAAAAGIIGETNLLPSICGRVCPQEKQCQAQCTLGKSLGGPAKAVQIGRLERFVADRAESSKAPAAAAPAAGHSTGKRVAVIGAGPAGLTCAADLRRQGHEVTVYEALQKAGGVMVYGIPEFRLPKALVRREADNLARLGVRFELDFLVGRTRPLRALLDEDGFDAAFVGTGAGLPKFMNIPGENLVGVFSANEYLTRANLMRAYDKGRAATPIYASRRVAVLGGGNVAMDSARMALRLGAEEVHILYRRGREELPARAEEVHHAEEEGVIFDLLSSPDQVLAGDDGRVGGLNVVNFKLGEPDASGRRSPVPIEGSGHFVPFDTVIVAIGNGSNPLIAKTTPNLDVDRHGHIVVDKKQKTSLDRVYAGGDIVLGSATVILAMGEGRRAAAAIGEILQ